MIKAYSLSVYFVLFLIFGLAGLTLAQVKAPAPAQPQTEAPKAKCGPDHKIIYKRAVALLDSAEKKLNARYTAEAKSLAKEAKSLFVILQKECGAEQKERLLTPKEDQQDHINQKLASDETAQAERLMKSAEEKFQQAEKLGASQPDKYTELMRQAKTDNDLAQQRSIRAMIYAMRTDQMVFSWLGK